MASPAEEERDEEGPKNRLSNYPGVTSATQPGWQGELYFGMVRAIGTELELVENRLMRTLQRALFVPRKIKLSKLIAEHGLVGKLGAFRDEYERYDRLMTAGDAIRSCTVRPDAAAVLGVKAINRARAKLTDRARSGGKRGIAYIISSLMHPAEVGTFREVYGPRFFVISAYSDSAGRRQRLEDVLTDAAIERDVHVTTLVDALMARDRGRGYTGDDLLSSILQPDAHIVLTIDKTFDAADFFVDTTSHKRVIAADIDRFIELVFGSGMHTPTRDELGMAHAYSARLRSSSLSRQVGAAICDEDGDVLATGTNDTPKPGGGLYWGPDPRRPDDLSPMRDIERGYDASDRTRREVFEDLIDRLLKDPQWLVEAVTQGNEAASVSQDLSQDLSSLLTQRTGE